MRAILTSTALASLLLVAGVTVSSPSALAQDGQPCVGENCPKPDMQGKPGKKGQDQYDQGTEDQTGQMPRKKKRIQGATDEGEMQDSQMPRKKKKVQQSQDVDVDVDVDVGTRTTSRSEWRFEPGKHRRSKSKSTIFRFYYLGYYYDQPYWEIYTIGPRRFSCGAGRAIVSERFNRVRVVECNGRTYTYIGRLRGDTWRILFNSRSGRIVGRIPI
jgi:hypothetical protein